MPALLHARKVQRRAAAVGFEYPDVDGALADLEDELVELKAELGDGAPERRAAELGDLLFACVNVARAPRRRPRARAAPGDPAASSRGSRRPSGSPPPTGTNWTKLELADQDRYFDLAKEMQ